MPRYIIKHVLIGFVALSVLVNATFFLMKTTPGSPFSLAKYKTPEALAAAKARHSLDKPLAEQYVIYPKGVARGNPREGMISTGHSVSCYIEAGLPVIARLGLVALVLALIGGTALGTETALSRHKWVNNLCMSVATIGVSVSSLLIAVIMLVVPRVQLHILPFIGLSSLLDYIIPAFSLTFYPIAMIARLTRSSMLEVVNQGYIILIRPKGTSYREVVIKHALKNAMLPVVTYTGPMFVPMLTGSLVIKSVLLALGIGNAFVSCITTRDYPIIMGLTIFPDSLVITFNLITDILSATIGPRVKLD